jgi:cytoskeleton protein RodZ
MSADRPAGSIGGKLRDARERRGVSLRQIANATKISVAALEALERDDISRLPGGIFSRAFVRSYATEVGLDPETAIQEFIAQFPNDSLAAGHPTSDTVEDHQAVESERRTAGTFLWLMLISVPVAVALLYFTSSGREAARSTLESAAAPPPAVPPPAVPPPAASAPVVERSPTPDGAAPDTLPATPAPTAPAPAQTPDAAAAPPSPAAEAPADRLTIGLSVKRPCWVSATVDGQKRIERLLQPGEQQTIEVRREMVLTAGDASAIAMTLNGADARPLGKAGEVVTARFNPTNFKTYLQAR